MLSRFKIEEGWLTLILVWGMIFVAASAVVQTELIDGLKIIPMSGTLAVLSGVALAKSRFGNRTAHFFALVYGLFVFGFLLSTILPGDLTSQEKLIEIGNRQLLWLRKAFGEGTSRDGLIFVMHTTLIFWVLGYSAAWFTFRYERVWRVVLPTGLVLLSVVYYYYGPKPLALYLAVYLLLALLYISQTHLVSQEKLWRGAEVRYERGIRWSFLQASLIAGFLALLVAWYMPALSANASVNSAISRVNQPWRKVQDEWTRLFSSLRSYGGATNDLYTDTLVLGGPRTAGSDLVMDVYVAKQLPYAYWQALVFDRYIDGSWQIAEGEEVLHYPEDGMFDTPPVAARQTVTQTIVNYRANSGIMYGAPEVIGGDRQMFITRQLDENGKDLILGVRSRFVLKQGDFYQVTSAFSTVDATSLRTAFPNYPAWVTDNYLQVPDTISPETRQLAAQLTAPYNNAYDKAIAIRDYLRATITYNDQIDAAPEGVDPIHYILFERREGYCNYYASAMAMMLRLQGVPARVVVGYAQGEWNEEGSAYRVRASDAHTWVEAYFPGYGWIQFEPTASLPPLDRPEAPNSEEGAGIVSPSIPDNLRDLESLLPEEDLAGDTSPENDPALEAETGFTFTTQFWLRAGIGLVLVVIVGSLLFLASQLNHQVEADVSKSYGRLSSWGHWLGVIVRPAHTPYERANLLSQAVPEGRTPIRNLTQQFVTQTFSPNPSPADSFNPLQEWKLLRPLLLRQAVINWLKQWRKGR